MKGVGFIVNPIAGLGGTVGLKGTDGVALQTALTLGASPGSPGRATDALKSLVRIRDTFTLAVGAGPMGELEAKALGFACRVIGPTTVGATTSEDTIRVAKEMAALGLDLILFAGGDGTARDILRGTNGSVTVLGIPTGVKIHSAVFAVSPYAAGELAAAFINGSVSSVESVEVMDIDEETFRNGLVSARLFGYLPVPKNRQITQGPKARSVNDAVAIASIARSIHDSMLGSTQYFIGPGSTTGGIKSGFSPTGSLLGVDVYRDGQLVARDVSERGVLFMASRHVSKIIVSPIGGQGFIFGRGNQQLSARAIRTVGIGNIIIVASPNKLASLRGRPLRVDTNDRALDAELAGYRRIVTGANRESVYRVSA